MTGDTLTALIDRAISAREALFDARHQAAFRLFNGFVEGCPALVIDLYASTLVIHNYADPPPDGVALIAEAHEYVRNRFPWIHTIVLKTRHTAVALEQQGILLAGSKPDRRVREHDVWYAVDLLMNRDASLYLDTRNLRQWAIQHGEGKSVLNTFAYTGSLGVAAQAGGAARVVQLDLNRRFLNVAKESYTLNGFPINKADFQTGDFWTVINQMKRKNELFDCVFVDPPIFAATAHGVVDLAQNYTKVINKVRPLITNGGMLVAINNALFLSGSEYMAMLEGICADGYVTIEEIIPIPEDFTGYEHTKLSEPITDPAPFNHSTKIVVLGIRRKE